MEKTKYAIIIALTIAVCGFAQDNVSQVQGKTREEMLSWIESIKAKDTQLEAQMLNANGTELRITTAERVELWDPKTVLEKVAEWKIAQLKDVSKQNAVRQNLKDTLEHIKAIWADMGDGSCSSVFSGSEVLDVIRRQIDIWLLPDAEYDAWMDWGNATLSFQGKSISLRSGIAIVKLKDGEAIEFSLQHKHCFTIDGEKYALVEKNYVASPCDDHYRVYLYRLPANGNAVLVEEVVREHFATKMKLSRENEACLRLDWQDVDSKHAEFTWILLVK